MKAKHLVICFLFLILFTTNCKKDLWEPTVYNFKVIDDYTNNPISECHVILETVYYPAGVIFDTLGFTDSNGNFKFNFDKFPSHEEQAYTYYSMIFFKNDYTKFKTDELLLNYKTNESIIKLNKNTTHCVVAINTSGNDLKIHYNATNFALSASVFDKPIGDTTYKYSKIPSNTNMLLRWNHNQDPYTTIHFRSSYNDTTYLILNY